MDNKNKTKLFFIAFLFSQVYITNIVFCQSQSTADSLLQIITIQENDTNKLRNLLLITRELKTIDPVQAFDYAKQSLHLSKELNNSLGLIDALSEISALYKSTGKLDSAKHFSENAISICDSIGDEKRKADNLLNYGSIIRSLGNTEEAFSQYKNAMNHYKNLNDSVGLIKVYNSFGIIYKIKGIYDSATFYYQESIRMCEKTGNYQIISASMINLGIIYVGIGDLENAKKYLNESIEYASKFQNINHLVIAYTNLGIVAYEEKKFEQALDYYNQALPLTIRIKNKVGTADLYNNIGNIYFQQKQDLNSAFAYYNKALPICKEIGYQSGFLTNLMNIAVINEGWGNYNQALKINDTCLIIAKEIGELKKQKTIFENTMAVYTHLGNYKKAFEYQSKYYEINDSIFNIEKTEVIADLTLKYEKEKDQARILALEKKTLRKEVDLRKSTNQRNIYLFTGSGIIVIILFLFVFNRHKARKDKIIADQKIKQLEEEKKLLAAKFLVEGQEEERKRIAQELHDGLGVLLSTTKMQFTTIKDKSPENKPIIEKATKLLEQATGDVRKISHNMMPGLLTKFGFYEATEDLFDKVNETEGLNTEVKIVGDTKRLPENTEIMLYRIIQEMINNTLKHAEAKKMILDIDIKPELLIIQYSDDGKGFDVDEKIESKSIGLQSIQSRVNFLNGHLAVDSDLGKGTKYKINVPTF